MNYYVSDEKTPDGESRVAAFNVQDAEGDLWIGVALLNEHTQAGTYRLSNGVDSINLVVDAERSTQGETLTVADELWETQ